MKLFKFNFIMFSIMLFAMNNSMANELPKKSAVVLSSEEFNKEKVDKLLQPDLFARQIIRAADRVRAPEEPFRYTVTLTEYKSGKRSAAAQQVLDISMRFYKPSEQKEKGDARALVRFVAPVKDKGKSLLSDFDKMWYYEANLRRPVPISKQQRLIGQISNGDVVAADFDFSYFSELVSENEMCDNRPCYKLVLKRRWPHVTYPMITYWIEKENNYPYRVDFQADNGMLIKRSFYSDYREALGRIRPHRIVVEDALKKDNYTTMEYSDSRFESLPESHFQKEYLMRLN